VLGRANLRTQGKHLADAAAGFELALQRDTPAAGFHDGMSRSLARLGTFE